MQLGGDPRLSDRRVTEWFLLEQARREHARETESPAPAPRRALPLITISRQFGAGGHTVACALAEHLGPRWKVWDQEIIDAVASSARVRSEMVASLDERTRSWVDEMAGNLANVQVMEAHTYRKHLVQVVLALAQQGHQILLGRGANFVLHEALNIRLYAPVASRARAAAAREHMTVEAAERRLHQVDRDRAHFTRSVYGRDITDPTGYDLMMNTAELKVSAVVEVIVAAARAMFGSLD